jgi:hypothetical protein
MVTGGSESVRVAARRGNLATAMAAASVYIALRTASAARTMPRKCDTEFKCLLRCASIASLPEQEIAA